MSQAAAVRAANSRFQSAGRQVTQRNWAEGPLAGPSSSRRAMNRRSCLGGPRNRNAPKPPQSRIRIPASGVDKRLQPVQAQAPCQRPHQRLVPRAVAQPETVLVLPSGHLVLPDVASVAAWLRKPSKSVPLMSSSCIAWAILPALFFTSNPSWSGTGFFGSSPLTPAGI